MRRSKHALPLPVRLLTKTVIAMDHEGLHGRQIQMESERASDCVERLIFSAPARLPVAVPHAFLTECGARDSRPLAI